MTYKNKYWICYVHKKGYITRKWWAIHLFSEIHYSDGCTKCHKCNKFIEFKDMPITVEGFKKKCKKCGGFTKLRPHEFEYLWY